MMFDITQRFTLEHAFKILNVSTIERTFSHWMMSTLLHDKVIMWPTATVHAYSDSIQCLGSVRAYRCKCRMERSTSRFPTVQPLERTIWNKCRTNRVRVECFPGTYNKTYNSGDSLKDASHKLEARRVNPKQFEDRTIFMYLFNDIDWTKGENSSDMSTCVTAFCPLVRFACLHHLSRHCRCFFSGDCSIAPPIRFDNSPRTSLLIQRHVKTHHDQSPLSVTAVRLTAESQAPPNVSCRKLLVKAPTSLGFARALFWVVLIVCVLARLSQPQKRSDPCQWIFGSFVNCERLSMELRSRALPEPWPIPPVHSSLEISLLDSGVQELFDTEGLAPKTRARIAPATTTTTTWTERQGLEVQRWRGKYGSVVEVWAFLMRSLSRHQRARSELCAVVISAAAAKL